MLKGKNKKPTTFFSRFSTRRRKFNMWSDFKKCCVLNNSFKSQCLKAMVCILNSTKSLRGSRRVPRQYISLLSPFNPIPNIESGNHQTDLQHKYL